MPSDLTDSDLTLNQTDREKLGPLVSVHPPASRMHKVNIAIASTFTLAMGIPAVLFLVGRIWIGAAVFGPLALGLAFGLFFLVRKLFWKLYLYENGFVWKRGRSVVVPWDGVKATIAQQDVMGSKKFDFWFRFILKDGTKFTIDSSYQQFDAFVEAAQDGVNTAILNRADAVFPKGEGVEFGKTLVTANGLEREGRFLPWADVERVAVEMGVQNDYLYSVVVYEAGKTGKSARWWMRGTTDFHNLDTFLTLAKRYAKVEDLPPT